MLGHFVGFDQLQLQVTMGSIGACTHLRIGVTCTIDFLLFYITVTCFFYQPYLTVRIAKCFLRVCVRACVYRCGGNIMLLCVLEEESNESNDIIIECLVLYICLFREGKTQTRKLGKF